ncbi:ATP-binding protein [Sphaerisporangium corydalis]|uniref:ATP-binding protein n=1 Tax=Sphaerisporangium corydalis TaxID=1441875 RepID=A0ABV9EKS1_9ACTN|nr:ATP-binding protein [Sphaerisporangium corydalis]
MAGVRARELYVEIPARLDAASLARAHVRRVLLKWRWEELSDLAELVVSELVTNAVKATMESRGSAVMGTRNAGAGHISVDVYRVAGLVVIEVGDTCRTPPMLKAAGPEDEGGRGLQLVDAVATRWGYRRPASGGKVVWCALHRPSRTRRYASE